MESQDLVAHVQAMLREGKRIEARTFLTQTLKADPRNVSAWLWLAETLDSDQQRIQALEQCLRINPNNPMAMKALSFFKSRLSPEPPVQAEQPATEQPLPPEESIKLPEDEPLLAAQPLMEPPTFEEETEVEQPESSTPFTQGEDQDLGEWRVLPTPDLQGPAEPLGDDEEAAFLHRLGSEAAEDEPDSPVFSDQVQERAVEPEAVRRISDEPGIAQNIPNPSARPRMVESEPEPAPKPKLPTWLIGLIVIVDVALLIIMAYLIVDYIIK